MYVWILPVASPTSVTGQLTDAPTRWLVKLQIGQLVYAATNSSCKYVKNN